MCVQPLINLCCLYREIFSQLIFNKFHFEILFLQECFRVSSETLMYIYQGYTKNKLFDRITRIIVISNLCPDRVEDWAI